jgi:hypothetical protein
VLRTPPNPHASLIGTDTLKRPRPDEESPKYTDIRDFSTLKSRVGLLEASVALKDEVIKNLLTKLDALTKRAETLESNLANEVVRINNIEEKHQTLDPPVLSDWLSFVRRAEAKVEDKIVERPLQQIEIINSAVTKQTGAFQKEKECSNLRTTSKHQTLETRTRKRRQGCYRYYIQQNTDRPEMRQVYPSCQNQRSEQQTPTGSIATSKRK